MSQFDTVVHLVAGGVGGTAGAIVTCPLEVVKTRLQSSVATFHLQQHLQSSASTSEHVTRHLRSSHHHHHHHVYVPRPPPPPPPATVSSVHQQQQQLRQPRFQINTVCTTVASSTSRAPEGVLTFGESTTATSAASTSCRNAANHTSIGIWKCLRYIIETEGTLSLFKGLGPNLVGVAPSRAIYFCTYSNAKSLFNQQFTPESPLVHMSSAVCAGFSASTVTNPIWFVKTRLQLDQRKKGGLTAVQCIGDIYRTKGVRGFYKGIAASYFGISETVIHLVVYEAIKAKLRNDRSVDVTDEKTTRDFVEFMMAGAMSKTFASILAYPHEVARTRLRQEGDKYRSFWQTLVTVFHEEGHRGLYRGLATQLIRQIPNTAIVMATYELVVHLLGSRSNGLTLSSPSQQRASSVNGRHLSDDEQRERHHHRRQKDTGD